MRRTENARLPEEEAQTVEAVLDARIRQAQAESQRRGLAARTLRSLLLTAAVTYLLFGVILGLSVVKGSSMNPAYREGDFVVFLRLGSRYRQGDVVLAHRDDKELIKRVVAIPGQTVQIDEVTGRVLIDGAPLPEPYVYSLTRPKPEVSYPLTLGAGEYFLLGDDRQNSMDSRNFGPIVQQQIDGRAIFVFRLQR